MDKRNIDITDKRFGKLTALRFDGDGKWLCRCDCGRTTFVFTSNLTKGNSQSCGCARVETLFRHGMARTPVYRVWMSMRSRCNNPNDQAFANYGGRGIVVCERWADFANFIADMGVRPKGFQIDRIDNDGNYEPGNCRWVTAKQNLNNKRTSRKVEWRGETRTLTEWADRLGLHQRTLFNRIGRGWDIERALTTPTLRRK